DLSLVRRYRSGVDDHTALSGLVRLTVGDRLGREGEHVEGADQVDLHDLGVQLQVVHAAAPEDAHRRTDTGAVDHCPQWRAAGRGRHCVTDVTNVGHIPGEIVNPVVAGVLNLLDSGREIERIDLRATLRQAPRGCSAETGGATGDEGGGVVQVHQCV